MADGDTYYHALRAERIARDWPHVPWIDPGMNHPEGAAIPWPPLLDQIIATVSVATGEPTSEHVARVAALVPVIAGVLLVLATAALARALLGGGAWWDAALLIALLPAAVRQSFVGRPDHHVLEQLLGVAAFLAYLRGSRGKGGQRWWIAGLSAALALCFWNWPGSALNLFILATHAGAMHLALPGGEPAASRAAGTLAAGGAGAAAILAATIALWGPPDALWSGSLTPITGLSVALCAATSLGSAVLWLSRRWAPLLRWPGRAGSLVVAASASALFLLAIPAGVRQGVERGLTALRASNAWFDSIGEFWPIVGSGRQPLTYELVVAVMAFGLTPFLAALAAWLLGRAWKAFPDRRLELGFLAVWASTTIGLAVARRRFESYAVVSLAVLAAWVVREGVGLARRRWTKAEGRIVWVWPALLLVVVAPGLPLVATGRIADPPTDADERFPLYRFLGSLQTTPGREGVFSFWSDGHEIQWFARKPVLSTPFGTEIGLSSLADEAAFFLESDPATAEDLLRRRRIGWILVGDPSRPVATLHPFAAQKPWRAIEERDAEFGSRWALHPEFLDLVEARLWFFDGGSRDGAAQGLEGYRLLAESDSAMPVLEYRPQSHKLFGVVPGALLTLRGLAPGLEVVATVPVLTNVRRDFVWRSRAAADASGVARMRVPYATGRNGAVQAGACSVKGPGMRPISVRILETQVVRGEVVDVLVASERAPR